MRKRIYDALLAEGICRAKKKTTRMSINQAERMLKCPKVSAVLERLRGRLAEAAG